VKRSNRLLILLGIIVAISGGVGAAVLANGSGGGSGGPGPSASTTPTPTPEPTTQVVVAKQDIHAGDTITAAMVGLKSMTISEATKFGPDTFNTVDQVIGNIAGVDITNGQTITASRDFISTGGTVTQGKDISAAITKGMVAISMEVDQTNGVGTLIVPGDHVDIILSVYVEQLAITSKDANNVPIVVGGGTQVTTKMVIRNRRILATLLAPAAPNPAGNATANPSAPVATPSATAGVVQMDGRHMTAIVELMPEEAELIRWAQRMEKQDPQNYIDLSFALRSRADDSTKGTVADTAGITYYQLVQNYGVLPPDPRALIPSKLGLVIQW
jgi:Flp pilus assembly protein CpaB